MFMHMNTHQLGDCPLYLRVFCHCAYENITVKRFGYLQASGKVGCFSSWLQTTQHGV